MAAFSQTLLWVALIVWALLRFEKVIGALFNAVTKRIEDGDELAGPGGFRIGVRQTPADEQKDRLQEEAQEVVRNVVTERDSPPAPPGQDDQHAPADAVSTSSPGVRQALEVAIRDVSDAQTLGLKWLGMTEGAQVLPNVKVGDIAFDGLLKRPDGKPQALVMVKLVNSLSQMAGIAKQAKTWSNMRRLSGTYGPLPISVVLVASERVASDTQLWQHIPQWARGAVQWYEIDLRQLRSMYGLEIE